MCHLNNLHLKYKSFQSQRLFQVPHPHQQSLLVLHLYLVLEVDVCRWDPNTLMLVSYSYKRREEKRCLCEIFALRQVVHLVSI